MVRIWVVRSWLVLFLAVASAACEVSTEEKVQLACSAFCSCTEAPLPALQNRCVAKCTSDADIGDVSDECLDCITANSDRCSTVQTVCEPICEAPQPQPGFDGGF